VNITQRMTASVIFAGLAAVGFASPAASADPPAETYQFNWVGGKQPTTWVVTPCGVMCLHVEDAGNSTTEPWSGDAYALNGNWTMFVNRNDFITCDNGEMHSAAAQYNWDSDGKGLASANNDGSCGDTPGPISANFTLTRVS
jgi:hypothetical protein